MKEYLTESTCLRMVAVIKHNSKIDSLTAENVAKGLKKGAMDNGATHYTHWFQPLTGTTAEKHDAFYKPSLDTNVQGMESLTAAELVQREPDASSFPHGGLRSAAQPRGYTVWDPSSPAFIMETASGKPLYIPSVYISYTGESLDYKTPLMKSNELLNRAATAICHYFDQEVNNVITTLGWEQEYFIIDENLYKARPDLILFHKKPFAGVNGTGKHNNGSMATDKGENLLSPGDNPGNNLYFLTFFINVIKGVSTHADLLRASIASADNDRRLEMVLEEVI